MSDTQRDPSGLPAKAPGAKAGSPPPRPHLYDTVRRRAVPPEAAAAMKDPACRVGRFVRVNLVGKGGMGTVYRGWEPNLGQWVALKFLKQIGDDAARACFLREAQLAASLDHPNIAKIYEVGEHEGLPFIAMQFVDGESLASAKKGMSLEAKLAAVESVVEAVKAAHERRVIHRDLKPANVMIDGKGHVTVMDFGLAKEAAFEGESAAASSVVAGTPSYMAPEQARGKADRQSDLYGIGAILYELVTGRPPFTGESTGDVLTQVMTQEIVWPRKLAPRTPADVEAIILKALEKERKRRYRTANQLLEDLAAFREGNPLRHARRPTWGYVLAKKVRRQPLLWGAVAAAIAAIVGGAAFGVSQLARRLKTEVAAREADARAERERRSKEEQVGREKSKREEADLYAGYERDLDLLRTNFYRPNYRLTKDEFAKYRKIVDRIREQMGKTGEIAQGWYLIGRCSEVVGDCEEADRAYARALELDSGHARTLHARGKMNLEVSLEEQSASQGKSRARSHAIERARAGADWVRRGAKFSGADESMERDLAKAYLYVVENWGKDLPPYSARPMLAKWRQQPFVEEFLVLEFMSGGSPEESCRELLSRVPSSYVGYYSLGMFLGKKRRYGEALAAYGRAAEINPRHAGTYVNRGMVHLDMGDHDAAIADWGKALELNPREAGLYHNRGSSRQIKGDIEGAMADYSRAIELDPLDPDPYINRGMLRCDRGELDGAMSDLNRAIEISPKEPKAYWSRSCARRKLLDLKGAIADCTKAIEFDPSMADAYAGRGLSRFDSGDIEGARSDYEAALRIDPRHASAYANRGILREETGDARGAMEDYGRAIECDPRLEEAYVNRGALRAHNQDFKGAIADYDKAIGINPRRGLTHRLRGFSRHSAGDPDGALADYEKAVELEPRNPDAYYLRGFGRKAKGDSAGAIRDFQKALDLAPPDWRFRRATEEALEELRKRP